MPVTTPAARLRSRAAPLLAALALAAIVGPARASGNLWDDALEKLDLKAAPAAPAPDFVERSRPDGDDTRYIPTALPHRVSPLKVKTPAEVAAAKAALDDAKARQLRPAAPKGATRPKERPKAPE